MIKCVSINMGPPLVGCGVTGVLIFLNPLLRLRTRYVTLNKRRLCNCISGNVNSNCTRAIHNQATRYVAAASGNCLKCDSNTGRCKSKAICFKTFSLDFKFIR